MHRDVIAAKNPDKDENEIRKFQIFFIMSWY